MDSHFTEDSGVADFNEQVWRVLRERGQTLQRSADPQLGPTISKRVTF